MSEQLDRIEQQLKMQTEELRRQNYLLARAVAFLDILSRLLVPAKFVTERLGLHENSLANNKKLGKFQPVEKRRNYLEIGEAVFVETNRPKSRLKGYFDKFFD